MGLTALKIEDLPHYTYDDYAQWEGRWEIISGVPYAMTPAPNLKHQRIQDKGVGASECGDDSTQLANIPTFRRTDNHIEGS